MLTSLTLVAVEGIEPRIRVGRAHGSDAELERRIVVSPEITAEGPVGIEPTRICLTSSRSTIELRSQIPVALLPPAAVARAAPSRQRVVHYARAKSAMTDGADASKPTMSTMPASPGSAMLNPDDVIPTTTSLAGMPRASR